MGKIDTQTQPQSAFSSILYFLNTLYLFTKSDFKTFIIPDAFFGLFGMLSGPVMSTPATPTNLPVNLQPKLTNILYCFPAGLLWAWLNCLLFDIANQRLPDAVEEDRINKPHRPIPAGRISSAVATRLLLFGFPAVFGFCLLWLGSAEEALMLTMFSYLYNDLGGSERYVVRNLLLAGMYVTYCCGCVRVAIGVAPLVPVSSLPFLSAVWGYRGGSDDISTTTTTLTLNHAAHKWIGVIYLVIFTTMQIQDVKDQEGDRVRGRSTIPLALGDGLARYSIAIPVLIWSIVGPTFWSLGYLGYVAPIVLGLNVAGRLLYWRGGQDGAVAADTTTWKWWALWHSSLYLLPLYKNVEMLLAGVK